MASRVFIGIDLGTSGLRACAINAEGRQIAIASRALAPPIIVGNAIEQDPGLWWTALLQVLSEVLQQIDPTHVQAICVDGTSGTLLVTDARGTPLAPALMYNDSRARDEAHRIGQIAPDDSAVHGATSGLAKLLYLQKHYPQACHALHQADWIAGKLCNRFDFSDANNALKTGYDVIQNQWPAWLDNLGVNRNWLPEVFAPGSCIANISPHWAHHFHLPNHTKIIAGTTDSMAAFMATGAVLPGEAVTSLGSTLVIKIMTEQPIFAPKLGVYSHRLGKYWLAGGASNSGGAVLRHYFTDTQMQAMSRSIKPEQPTGLDYYPLLRPGERFPVNDANLQPRLTPRPEQDVIFFQAMLEAMASIENQGYSLLQQLGAAKLRKVITTGGGSCNSAWSQIRQQKLNVPVYTAKQTDACYGSALLAFQNIDNTAQYDT